MRKLLMFLLLALPILTTAQVKKTNKPAAVNKSVGDSLTLPGNYKTDTTKAYIILYAEDASGYVNLIRIKGYVIATKFEPTFGQAFNLQAVAKNEKWETIKPDDIYDVRTMNWK